MSIAEAAPPNACTCNTAQLAKPLGVFRVDDLARFGQRFGERFGIRIWQGQSVGSEIVPKSPKRLWSRFGDLGNDLGNALDFDLEHSHTSRNAI